MQGEVRISIKADIVPILTALNKTQKSIMNLQKRINKLAPEISDKLAKNFKDLGHSIEFSVKKMKELGKATKKVIPDMNLLGVGFFGMMIKRGFGMIMRAGTETFLTLAAGSRLVSENYGKFVALLNYSKFLLGSALMGTINGFISLVNTALEKFNSLSPTMKKIVAWTLILGFGFGTILEKVGFIVLGIQSLMALKLGTGISGLLKMIKWIGEGTFLINLKEMWNSLKALAVLKFPSLIAFGKGLLKIGAWIFFVITVWKTFEKVLSDSSKKVYSWSKPFQSFTSLLAEGIENILIVIGHVFVSLKVLIYSIEYVFKNVGRTIKASFYDVLSGIIDKFRLFVGLVAKISGSDRMQKWADSLGKLYDSLKIKTLETKIDMASYVAKKLGVSTVEEAYITGFGVLRDVYAHKLKTNSKIYPFFDKSFVESTLRKYGYYNGSLSENITLAQQNLARSEAKPTQINNVVLFDGKRGETQTFRDYLDTLELPRNVINEIDSYLYGSNNS